AEVLGVFLHRGDVGGGGPLSRLEGGVLVAVLDKAGRLILIVIVRDVRRPVRAKPGKDAHSQLPPIMTACRRSCAAKPSVRPARPAVRYRVGSPSRAYQARAVSGVPPG